MERGITLLTCTYHIIFTTNAEPITLSNSEAYQYSRRLEIHALDTLIVTSKRYFSVSSVAQTYQLVFEWDILWDIFFARMVKIYCNIITCVGFRIDRIEFRRSWGSTIPYFSSYSVFRPGTSEERGILKWNEKPLSVDEVDADAADSVVDHYDLPYRATKRCLSKVHWLRQVPICTTFRGWSCVNCSKHVCQRKGNKYDM